MQESRSLLCGTIINVGLFNGDLGIVLPDAITGELRVFFRGEEDAVLNFAPGTFAGARTGTFALTVHKSQGSGVS